MDSTDPQTQSQPQTQAPPPPQQQPQPQPHQQTHQQPHQPHHHHHHQQHQHHPHPQQTHQHQRPTAGPQNTQHQQQQHIQSQPQIHPNQHQHAQTAGYAPPQPQQHQGMQYSTYPAAYYPPPRYSHQTYVSNMAQYPPNMAYPAPYQSWQGPAAQFPQTPVVAPSSQELSNTTHVAALAPRPKQRAVITDPKTGKPIDLGEESKPNSSSKSLSAKTTATTTTTTTESTTKTSTQPSATITPASSVTTTTKTTDATPMTAATALKKNNPIIAANTNNVSTNSVTVSSNEKTNTPPQPIHTLLQKVSEDTSSDKRQVGTTAVAAAPTVARTNAATITAPIKTTKATVTSSAIKPATTLSTTTTTKALPIVPPPAATASLNAVTSATGVATPSSPAKTVKVAQGQENVVEKKTSSPAPAQVEKPVEADAKVNNINGKLGEDKTENEIKPEKGGDSKELKETSSIEPTRTADVVDKQSKDSIEASTDNNGENKRDVQEGGGEEKEREEKEKGVIELHYEAGQYNPMSNRIGKKKYGRDFLIEVCEKICKLTVFDGEIEDNSMENYSFSNQIDMFQPQFSKMKNFPQANRQNDPNRRPNQQPYMGRSSTGQERQRKVIASTSLTNEVELKTVANPWRPGGKEVKENISVDVVELEDLKKKFRSILNKLTPNNFDNLSQSVTGLNIDTEGKLGEVIDIVFAKALAEPGYCTLYGQMCSHLKKTSAGTTNFGNTLLKRCQHQFQSDIYSGLNVDERKQKIEDEESADVKKHLNEELYEDMFRCRMRGLGLIKFIGELYKIEMLNDAIMLDCILRLLMDTSEESLECLCDLLVTIGEKLDRSSQNSVKEDRKAQKGPSKTNAYQGGKTVASIVAAGANSSGGGANAQQKGSSEGTATLDDIFAELHKIRKNKDLPISLRIRFKLLDVCELREKENWQSKKAKENNPKKIEEIREAHMEKLDAERKKDAAIGPRRSQEGGGRRGLGHSSGSSSQISSLAYESGVNRGGANMHASASSHSIRDHSSIEDQEMPNNMASISMHKQNVQSTKSFLSNFNKQQLASSNNQTDRTSLRPAGFLRPGGGASSTHGSLRPAIFGLNRAVAGPTSAASGGATTTGVGGLATDSSKASSGLAGGSAAAVTSSDSSANTIANANAAANDITTNTSSRTTNNTDTAASPPPPAAVAAATTTTTTNCK